MGFKVCKLIIEDSRNNIESFRRSTKIFPFTSVTAGLSIIT